MVVAVVVVAVFAVEVAVVEVVAAVIVVVVVVLVVASAQAVADLFSYLKACLCLNPFSIVLMPHLREGL